MYDAGEGHEVLESVGALCTSHLYRDTPGIESDMELAGIRNTHGLQITDLEATAAR